MAQGRVTLHGPAVGVALAIVESLKCKPNRECFLHDRWFASELPRQSFALIGYRRAAERSSRGACGLHHGADSVLHPIDGGHRGRVEREAVCLASVS